VVILGVVGIKVETLTNISLVQIIRTFIDFHFLILTITKERGGSGAD